MPQIILQESALIQPATFTRDVDQYKNTSLSQLYQPPRTPFSHNTYHQLHSSCEYWEVLKTAFLQNTSGSSRLRKIFKIGVLRSFANFTGKHLCWSLFLKNLQAEGLQLHKIRLQHKCFPVKFAKFLRTPFLTEHLQ